MQHSATSNHGLQGSHIYNLQDALKISNLTNAEYGFMLANPDQMQHSRTTNHGYKVYNYIIYWRLCFFVCLFDLILYVPSTIFQLYRDGSSWVEPN